MEKKHKSDSYLMNNNEQFLEGFRRVDEMAEEMTIILLELSLPMLYTDFATERIREKCYEVLTSIRKNIIEDRITGYKILRQHLKHKAKNRRTFCDRVRQMIATERNAEEIYLELAIIAEDEQMRKKLQESAEIRKKHLQLLKGLIDLVEG